MGRSTDVESARHTATGRRERGPGPDGGAAGLPVVPVATRARRPGWRDPRLLVGLVVVAGCVLLGARLMAAADDTVPVWSAARDLPAGATVSAGDVDEVRVRFGDGAAADRYLSTSPKGQRLGQAVGAGELIPGSAIADGPGAALVEVPLSLAPDDLPATVRPGVMVDVWVTPRQGGGEAAAVLVLDDVTVVSVSGGADSLAPQQTRQVIVGVPPSSADVLAEALGLSADGRVVLTREVGS